MKTNFPLDRGPEAGPAKSADMTDTVEDLAFRVTEIGLTTSLLALEGLLAVIPDGEGDGGYAEAAASAAALARQMLDGTAGLVRTLGGD